MDSAMTENIAEEIAARKFDNRAAHIKDTSEKLSATAEQKTKLLEFLCYGRQGNPARSLGLFRLDAWFREHEVSSKR